MCVINWPALPVVLFCALHTTEALPVEVTEPFVRVHTQQVVAKAKLHQSNNASAAHPANSVRNLVMKNDPASTGDGHQNDDSK